MRRASVLRLPRAGNSGQGILGVIDIVEPIFAAQHKPVRPGLEPQDIATNEFIDPRIGLPS